MKQKTITRELLIKAGYNEYEKDKFQKKFTDVKGVKFFINVVHYGFEFLAQQNITSWWEASIQFNTELGSIEIKTVQWFNEDGIFSGNNIEHAEHYFEKMWIWNGRPYYEEY